MHESTRVWFCFTQFQLQPVPGRVERPGCYQLVQDVWSELSSADIWFCLLSVVRSKPEQLTMSRWGVQQTWCHERCGLSTTIFNLHEMYEFCRRGGQVGGVSSTVPAWHQWAKQNPKVVVHHPTPRLQNSAWSDLASLPSGAPQRFSPSVCVDITLHPPENTNYKRNKLWAPVDLVGLICRLKQRAIKHFI